MSCLLDIPQAVLSRRSCTSISSAISSMEVCTYIVVPIISDPHSPRSPALFRYSLVTFGSPPAISPNLTSRLPERSGGSAFTGVNLNFVNEYDLVSRTSRSYIRSLVDLLRSIYHLPKIEDNGNAADDWEVLHGFGVKSAPHGTLNTHGQNSLQVWDLPLPELHHTGPTIVLKAAYHHDDTTGDAAQDWDLCAYTVEPSEFARLLFCRISVHARQIYVENIREIAQGRLHGRGGW